jgi:hypothetical protein
VLHTKCSEGFFGHDDCDGGSDRGEAFRIGFNLGEEYLVPSIRSGPQPEQQRCLFGLASSDAGPTRSRATWPLSWTDLLSDVEVTVAEEWGRGGGTALLD